MPQWKDAYSYEYRNELWVKILELFRIWEIPEEKQWLLLGISKSTYKTYADREAIGNNHAVIARAQDYIAIGKYLEYLLPPTSYFRWMTTKNSASPFNGICALDYICCAGKDENPVQKVKEYLRVQRVG